MRRRDLLVFGGIMAAAVAVPPILRRLPAGFAFEPITGFDGFRRLQGGALSGAIDPFFGLSERLPEQVSLPDDAPRSPCSALFGPLGWQSDRLPIAIFSDFNCPYCKELEQRLIDLRDGGALVRLIWHEMPLLGDRSYRAAKAVLAARFSGVEEQARQLLWHQPLRPGPAALDRFAQTLNISPETFSREYNGARVASTLSQSLGLGLRLGIPGTPGTVIGRTLVVGTLRQPDLLKLIALEAGLPAPPCA